MNPIYNEVVSILTAGTETSSTEIHAIMEDAENPLRRKTLDKLYTTLRDKKYVNFGDIAKSAGDIQAYSGYDSMVATLGSLQSLEGTDIKTTREFQYQVQSVQDAILNIKLCKKAYTLAFTKKVEPIMLEYNTFVAACVEATTSLLYNFVDYTRNPGSNEIQQVLKNTDRRGDLFYIEQLQAFNRTVQTGSYRNYLKSVVEQGSNYFLGIDDALAMGTVAIVTTVALGIVPVTRKLIYTYQDMKRKLADSLELQAYYLELNQSILEAKDTMSANKKEQVLKKQAALRLKFLRLADKLRVESKRNEALGKKVLDEDNRMLSVDSMRDEINDSDFAVV